MVTDAAPEDDVAATLRDLAEHYARRLGRTARVDRVYGEGVRVRLRPSRTGAVDVGWSDAGGEIEVVVGDHGWRRIGREPLDPELLRVVCDAVVGGDGHQVCAPGRALLTLTPSGRPAIRLTVRTGWTGLVPLPFWTRWGRRTQYAPYS